MLLLCDMEQQYLGQGQTPPEVFYKASAAKKLRDSTMTALAEVNAQEAVVAEAVQKKQASSFDISMKSFVTTVLTVTPNNSA